MTKESFVMMLIGIFSLAGVVIAIILGVNIPENILKVVVSLGGVLIVSPLIGWAFASDLGISKTNKTQSSAKIFRPKSPKLTNPWVQIPKVQVKKEEEEIPPIWDNKVLVGG